MQIRQIEIDGFGILRDLHLSRFHDGLNVVHGLNGTGKTTIVQFLRGVLYGFAPGRRQGYLPSNTSETFGGRVLTSHRDENCLLSRVDDGHGDGELSFGDSSRITGRETLADFHRTIDRTVFELLCSVGLKEVHQLNELLEAVERSGLDLTMTTESPLRSAWEEEQASALHLAQLIEQKMHRLEQLEQEIAAAERVAERQASHSTEELTTIQKTITQLTTRLREVENELLQLSSITDTTPASKITTRVTTTSSQESTIPAAINTLTERQTELQAKLRNARQPTTDVPTPDSYQANNLLKDVKEQLLSASEDSQSLHGSCDCDELRDGVAETLDWIEDHETEWSPVWEAQLAQVQSLQWQTELIQVERCLQELQRYLDLSGEQGASTVYTSATEIDTGSGFPWENSSSRQGHDDVTRVTRERLERERDDLQESLRLSESRAAKLANQRPTATPDQHLGQHREEHRELTQEIRSLERQQAEQSALSAASRPQTTTVHHPVWEEASECLQQLTNNEYQSVRWNGTHRLLEVERADRTVRTLPLLSRGTLDQVSLSLRLAIASAYQQAGSPVPLIFDDVLVDSDVHRALAAAKLLKHYGKKGQQILFFTCQHHLIDVFKSLGVDVRDLPQPHHAPPQPRGRQAADYDSQTHYRTDSQNRYSESSEEHTSFDRQPDREDRDSRQEDELRQERDSETVSVPGFSILDSSSLDPFEHIVLPEDEDHFASDSRNDSQGPAATRSTSQHRTYTLEYGDPVELLPSLTGERVADLHGMGVRTINDLLSLNIKEYVPRFEQLHIKPHEVQIWMGESLLLCGVEGLSKEEVQILTRCGIFTPQDLEETDEQTLLDTMIRHCQHSQNQWERDYTFQLRSSTIRRWRQRARNARQPSFNERSSSRSHSGSSQRESERSERSADADRKRSRRSQRDRDTQNHNLQERTDYDQQSNRDREESQQQEYRSRTSSRREHSRNEHERGERDERSRSSNRREKSTRSDSRDDNSRLGNTLSSSAQERPLRFRLELDSPVEHAPSIGSRTAQRLHDIDVRLVRELLAVHPETAARRLNTRHITAQTLRDWQAQALLMCRVPEIRSTEAQILVACGLTDPEVIAQMHPQTLLQQVTPFVESPEGKRILRHGKTLELNQVSDWILQAQQSRQVKAA